MGVRGDAGGRPRSHTMSKYGTFSEPGYNSIGDPYEKKQSRDDRHGGLNFKSGSRRTGKGNDATFGKFAPLYAGEKYSQDYKEKRRARLESQKGYVQTAPFRPSNPGKESSGLGGDYGCLSKVSERNAAQGKLAPLAALRSPPGCSAAAGERAREDRETRRGGSRTPRCSFAPAHVQCEPLAAARPCHAPARAVGALPHAWPQDSSWHSEGRHSHVRRSPARAPTPAPRARAPSFARAAQDDARLRGGDAPEERRRGRASA